jgi:hypothetical protein
MSSKRSNKQAPYFTGFLKALADKGSPMPGNPAAMALGCLGPLFVAPAVGVMAGFSLGVGPGIIAGVLAAAGCLAGGLAMENRARRPKSPAEARKMQARSVANVLRSLGQQRKLHKQVDPLVLQLLEVGAYHWTRIRARLDMPAWTTGELPAHRVALRTQIQDAADAAMDDLLLLAQGCIGDPERNRGDDLKSAFEDLADLDISQALAGFRRVAETDWTAYAHHSPNSGAVMSSGRPVVEKLAALADEVESMALPSLEAAPQTASTDSLDVLLSEIKSIRQAEQELEQRLGQG